MKISILGSGWLGLPLAEKLQIQKFNITSTYFNSPKNFLDISFVQYGLGDNLPHSLRNANVFILTTPPGLRRNPLSSVIENHKKLISEISENAYFIYTSSISAYGNSKGLSLIHI